MMKQQCKQKRQLIRRLRANELCKRAAPPPPPDYHVLLLLSAHVQHSSVQYDENTLSSLATRLTGIQMLT